MSIDCRRMRVRSNLTYNSSHQYGHGHGPNQMMGPVPGGHTGAPMWGVPPYYGQSPFNPMQPMNQFTDPNNTTVFVGGLSGYVTEDELRSFFQGFGEITYVKIPPGKGCGFVQFVHRHAAEMAINQMQGYPIGNSRVRLSWGRSQNNSGVGTPYRPAPPPPHYMGGIPPHGGPAGPGAPPFGGPGHFGGNPPPPPGPMAVSRCALRIAKKILANLNRTVNAVPPLLTTFGPSSHGVWCGALGYEKHEEAGFSQAPAPV